MQSERRRLRMAAIDFLNPAPLMWDFEHEPGLTQLAAHYEITYTTPARCAAQLASGEADLGLVPVAAFAMTPSLKVVPGCTVASLERVRSIFLVVRAQQGLAGVRTVAADTSSLTSFAYCRILFQKFWKVPAEFLACEPRLDVMLAAADAALLIGDPALLALEDARAREQRTGEALIYLDLAQEWHRFTGLPWVSAFWAVRPEALAEAGMSAADVVSDLQRSRDHGLEQIEALVSEWAPRIKVPAETIRSYLTTNIWYHLDDRCLHGLREFYRLAAECGALPPVPSIAML
jgi:chorismate dehydratase